MIVYPLINTYEKHEIPMVLIESMSMKKPIIVFDTVPINEIIIKDEGVKAKTYLDFKNAIIKFIENKTLSKRIGKLARKRVLNDFNIVETAKNYEKLYEKL